MHEFEPTSLLDSRRGSVFSPVLNPSRLIYAALQLRKPSRRTASSANVPFTIETFPRVDSSMARRDSGSRLKARTAYLPSATSARMTGNPCAPVPPMTNMVEGTREDMFVYAGMSWIDLPTATRRWHGCQLHMASGTGTPTTRP